jgi:hypothetical protein
MVMIMMREALLVLVSNRRRGMCGGKRNEPATSHFRARHKDRLTGHGRVVAFALTSSRSFLLVLYAESASRSNDQRRRRH